MGEGGLVLAGDDDRDLHRLQEFAERNQLSYRTVLRSDAPAWSELAKTTALPEAGTVVVTGERRVMSAPTTRNLATALGIDLWCLSDDSRCDLLVVALGGGAGGRRLRGLGGARCGRRRGRRHRGPGRAAVADRELPRLSPGVSGVELARAAMLQAVKFGTRLVSPRSVTGLSQVSGGFRVLGPTMSTTSWPAP